MENNNEGFVHSQRPPVPKAANVQQSVILETANKKQNILPAIITYPIVAVSLSIVLLNGMAAALLAAVISGAVYALTNSKRYQEQTKKYQRLHGNPQTYTRALNLATYPSDNNICQTCYLPFTEFKADNTHSCDIKVGYIQSDATYDAVLKDWQGLNRWVCGHKHTEAYDAEMCGWQHYDMHVSGACRCTYFPQTTTPSSSNQPRSHVYIMVNEALNAVKIGISSNVVGVRIREHVDNGWQLVAYYPNLMWETAYNAEQSTIEQWRKNNVGFGVYFNEMPQKGATETAPLHIVDIKKLVDAVADQTGVQPQYSLEAGK